MTKSAVFQTAKSDLVIGFKNLVQPLDKSELHLQKPEGNILASMSHLKNNSFLIKIDGTCYYDCKLLSYDGPDLENMSLIFSFETFSLERVHWRERAG